MKPNLGRHWATFILTCCMSLTAGRSWAEPTLADKETARTLVLDGRVKLQAGDAKGALKAFQAAHAIMGVPTTGLDLAQAQEALQMLLEARATAIEVSRMPAHPNDPPPFTKARAAAEKLAEDLAKRIPSLEIRVGGLMGGVTPTVTLDGVSIPVQTLGVPRKLNPGEHIVTVDAPGYVTARRTILVEEKKAVSLDINLDAKTAAAAGPEQHETKVAQPSIGQSQRPAKQKTPTWAWVSGGAGVVMTGMGIAFAVDYAIVRSTVASDCPNNICDPRLHSPDDVESLGARWNRDLPLALGFGLIGAGAIWFSAPLIFGKSPQATGKPRGTSVDVALSVAMPGALMKGVF